MKKHNSKHFLLTGTLLALAIAQPAYAVPVADTYVGADDHGYGDVIGSTSNFQIYGMDVSMSGTVLTVNINSTFAGKGDNGLFAGYTNTAAGQGNGIGYGDLFLSSSWDPFGSSANGYLSDDSSNGTLWTYGFSLDNRWMNEALAGTGTLYSLNSGNNNANALMSNDFLSGATYRNNQEVAVDTTSDVTAITTGNWSIDVVNQLINFDIDLAGTSLVTGSEIALHWGFTCANDVIEGSIVNEVPEPGILWLLSTGLIGFTVLRRRHA
jgi:hypothetical protein